MSEHEYYSDVDDNSDDIETVKETENTPLPFNWNDINNLSGISSENMKKDDSAENVGDLCSDKNVEDVLNDGDGGSESDTLSDVNQREDWASNSDVSQIESQLKITEDLENKDCDKGEHSDKSMEKDSCKEELDEMTSDNPVLTTVPSCEKTLNTGDLRTFDQKTDTDVKSDLDFIKDSLSIPVENKDVTNSEVKNEDRNSSETLIIFPKSDGKNIDSIDHQPKKGSSRLSELLSNVNELGESHSDLGSSTEGDINSNSNSSGTKNIAMIYSPKKLKDSSPKKISESSLAKTKSSKSTEHSASSSVFSLPRSSSDVDSCVGDTTSSFTELNIKDLFPHLVSPERVDANDVNDGKNISLEIINLNYFIIVSK